MQLTPEALRQRADDIATLQATTNAKNMNGVQSALRHIADLIDERGPQLVVTPEPVKKRKVE